MTTPNGQNRQGGGASKVAHLHLDRSVGAAVNELVDVGIAGAVDLRRRADPDDLALVEHGDAFGDAPGAGHVVGDRQGGRAQALPAPEAMAVYAFRSEERRE